MESIQSKVFKIVIRIINLKKVWKLTGDDLKKDIDKKQLLSSHEPPKKVKSNCNITKGCINGCSFYVMKPFNNVSQKHILYLHGGGFVFEIMSHQWKFLSLLVDALHCTITVPIYPLVPKYQYQEVFDMLIPIYQQIVSQVKLQDIVIMGDSAGGGISLSLAELLKQKYLPQPGNIILISPTLDMSFSNPEIYKVEKLDPMSAVPALKDIGKWYGGVKGSKYYLVSPIYGDFIGLGKISLFIGTHDIFYPDAKKFKTMADEKKVLIDYYEYSFMIHAFVLFFFPESRKAFKQIINIIQN